MTEYVSFILPCKKFENEESIMKEFHQEATQFAALLFEIVFVYILV